MIKVKIEDHKSDNVEDAIKYLQSLQNTEKIYHVYTIMFREIYRYETYITDGNVPVLNNKSIKKLKSLDQHNAEIREVYYKCKRHFNGICCPNCGEELYDINPNSQLMSNPAKMEIACYKCTYNGYRLC